MHSWRTKYTKRRRWPGLYQDTFRYSRYLANVDNPKSVWSPCVHRTNHATWLWSRTSDVIARKLACYAMNKRIRVYHINHPSPNKASMRDAIRRIKEQAPHVLIAFEYETCGITSLSISLYPRSGFNRRPQIKPFEAYPIYSFYGDPKPHNRGPSFLVSPVPAKKREWMSHSDLIKRFDLPRWVSPHDCCTISCRSPITPYIWFIFEKPYCFNKHAKPNNLPYIRIMFDRNTEIQHRHLFNTDPISCLPSWTVTPWITSLFPIFSLLGKPLLWFFEMRFRQSDRTNISISRAGRVLSSSSKEIKTCS